MEISFYHHVDIGPVARPALYSKGSTTATPLWAQTVGL